MGQPTPGFSANRSASFQTTYVTPVAGSTDLTEVVTPAKCACSGMLVVVATTGTFIWKDCRGTSNTISLPVGVFDLPFSATTVEVGTAIGSVTPYWHNNGAK